MKKYILSFLLVFSFSLFLCIGFLFFTNAGLIALMNITGAIIPFELQIDRTKGSLAGGFSFRGGRYDDGVNTITVDKLTVSWSPTALLRKKLIIKDVAASGIDVKRKNISAPERKSSRQVISPPVPPLSVTLENATFDNITIAEQGRADSQKTDSIILKQCTWEGKIIQFDRAAISAQSYSIGAKGQVLLDNNFLTDITVNYSFSPPGYNTIMGEGTLSGTLAEINISTRLEKPFEGLLHGRIDQPFAAPLWQAGLDAESATLSAINPGWPQFTFSGFTAEGKGDLTTYSVQIDTIVDYASLKDINLATVVTGDMKGLHFTETHIRHEVGSIEGRGQLNWEKQFIWAATVSGNKIDPNALTPDWPEVLFSRIDIEGQGEGAQYTLQIQADGIYEKFDRPVHAITTVTGNADGMRISEATLSQNDAELDVEAQLSWQEGLTWHAAINGKQLNPAVWNPDFAGDIDVELQTEGNMNQNGAAGHLEIISLEGVLRDYPMSASGKADFIGKDFNLHDIVLQTVGTKLTASGHYAETVDLQFEAVSSDLSVILPDLEGSFDAQGYIRGQRKHPVTEMNISGEGIKGFGNSIGLINGEVNADLAADGNVNMTFIASELSVAEMQIDSLHADLHGSTKAHTLNIDVLGDEINLELLYTGGLNDEGLDGTIEQAEMHSDIYDSWYLLQPAEIRITNDGFIAGDLCMTGLDRSRICLSGNYNKSAGWQMESAITALPISWLLQAAGIELNTMVRGDITGSTRLIGQKGVLQHGSVDLSSENTLAYLQLTEGDEYELAWQKNIIHLDYSDKVLTTQVESILSDGSQLSTSLRSNTVIPFSTALKEIPINGKVHIDIRDLDPLAVLTLPLVEPSGSLVGDVKMTGTLGDPLFDGYIQLANGRMAIPQAGILVEDLELQIEGTRDQVDLRLSGKSGDGNMTADGKLTIDPEKEINVQLAVRGNTFEVFHMPELKLIISPQLDLQLEKQEIFLSGRVRVDDGIIAPYSIGGAVTPSRDVVFVRKDKRRKEYLPVSADLKIVITDDVEVNAFGLRGKLKGDIRIVDIPNKLATATGNLDVIDGTFTVYGTELKITTGQLLFSGGPVYDPGVSVRAENKTKDVTTGIAVSGFLRKPEINFYSDPQMEENEIISRLLLNTKLVGDDKDDSGLITSATSDSKLAPIGSVVQGTKDAFRVDDVRVETGKGSEDVSLIIGTWITPSLYLSYGKNLLKESGSFNTRYVLGYGFSLETETGNTESGVDLKYEIEK